LQHETDKLEPSSDVKLKCRQDFWPSNRYVDVHSVTHIHTQFLTFIFEWNRSCL